MSSNGIHLDPFCNKDFWENQLGAMSSSELRERLSNFEHYATEIEDEFRIAMSPGRTKICLEVMENLLRRRNRKNSNQGDLFT